MRISSIFFITAAIINIIAAIIKWISTGDNQFSTVFGWFCAIIFCIETN